MIFMLLSLAGVFADIFYMHCMKNSILPIVMDKMIHKQFTKTDASDQIEVDLKNEVIIKSIFHIRKNV